MTQIFGSVAYVRDSELTFVLSDRKISVSRQIQQGFYAHDSIATKNTPPLSKVIVAGDHIYGIGGNYFKQNYESPLSEAIGAAQCHEEAKAVLIDQLKMLAVHNGTNNSYLIGTLGRTPRFSVGLIVDGNVDEEEQCDTAALHRNKKNESDALSSFTKYWLSQDWLKGTIYHEKTFTGDSYRPMLDVMSDFFVTDMRKESDYYELGVSKEWDVTIMLQGSLLKPDFYLNPLSQQSGFLHKVRTAIESEQDEFLQELFFRLAWGGIKHLTYEAARMSFPRKYHAKKSLQCRIFESTIGGKVPMRDSMGSDQIEMFCEYIENLEKFWMNEEATSIKI